jgi:hypothetical protein
MKGMIARIILFLLLAVCLSFQVWDSWRKFWDGKTSMAVSVDPAQLEPLPSFTLCTQPFTNADVMRDKFNISDDALTLRRSLFTDTLPENVTLNDIWEQSSYTPNWIRFGNDDITLDGINFNATGEEISKVEQINSLFLGKCLSIFPRKARNAANENGILTVEFPHNQIPKKVKLLLHETPGARYSLIPGDYTSPGTKIYFIELGNIGTLRIGRTVKKYDIQRSNGLCKEYDLDDSVEKCNLQKLTLQQIATCHLINRTDICSIPQALNIFQLNGITNTEPCTTIAEHDCLTHAMLTTPSSRNKYCPKPCTEKTLKTALRMTEVKEKNKFDLYMLYQSDEIEMYEEYLIYDFPGIVSSLGGSLGLFLGFSFFQCGDYFMTKVSTLWKKTRHARLQNGEDIASQK